MSISIVNGYVCTSCSDVSLAQKGVDPAHPQDDPKSPSYNAAVAQTDAAKNGQSTPSVIFGGQLAAKTASALAAKANASATDPNAPAANATASATNPNAPVANVNSIVATLGVNAASQPYRPGSVASVSA